MTDTIDISPAQRRIILDLLGKHLPNVSAWAYGSRVKWTARPASDLDMVVFSSPGQEQQVGRLKEAFEESSLPFRVDLFVWDEVPEAFRKGILTEHAVLVEETNPTVPKGWKTIKLGSICSKIGSGATPRGGSKVYLDNGPFALVRSQNVRNEGFTREGLTYITSDQADDLANVELQPKDVLLNITGDSVARCCLVDEGVLPGRVNQHVAIIRPEPDQLDPIFLRYALISPKMQQKMLSWAGVGATRNALTKSMIEAFDVICPSPATQRVIAHILGTLDDKIELNRRMNRALEKMAAAIFKSWFIDFDPVRAKAEGRDPGLPADIAYLFPDSFEESELGAIPKGWTSGSLGDVAGSPRRGVNPADVPPTTPYIGLEHLPRRCIALDDWGHAEDVASGKSQFRQGEILFGKLRSYFHKVGIAPIDGVCSTDIVVVTPKSNDWHGYVISLVSSKAFVDYTDSHSAGTKMPRTNWNDMSRYPLVRPPEPLAKVFQRQVADFHRRIMLNVCQNRRLSGLRNTLLPKIMCGEIEVPDTVVAQWETTLC